MAYLPRLFVFYCLLTCSSLVMSAAHDDPIATTPSPSLMKRLQQLLAAPDDLFLQQLGITSPEPETQARALARIAYALQLQYLTFCDLEAVYRSNNDAETKAKNRDILRLHLDGLVPHLICHLMREKVSPAIRPYLHELERARHGTMPRIHEEATCIADLFAFTNNLQNQTERLRQGQVTTSVVAWGHHFEVHHLLQNIYSRIINAVDTRDASGASRRITYQLLCTKSDDPADQPCSLQAVDISLAQHLLPGGRSTGLLNYLSPAHQQLEKACSQGSFISSVIRPGHPKNLAYGSFVLNAAKGIIFSSEQFNQNVCCASSPLTHVPRLCLGEESAALGESVQEALHQKDTGRVQKLIGEHERFSTLLGAFSRYRSQRHTPSVIVHRVMLHLPHGVTQWRDLELDRAEFEQYYSEQEGQLPHIFSPESAARLIQRIDKLGLDDKPADQARRLTQEVLVSETAFSITKEAVAANAAARHGFTGTSSDVVLYNRKGAAYACILHEGSKELIYSAADLPECPWQDIEAATLPSFKKFQEQLTLAQQRSHKASEEIARKEQREQRAQIAATQRQTMLYNLMLRALGASPHPADKAYRTKLRERSTEEEYATLCDSIWFHNHEYQSTKHALLLLPSGTGQGIQLTHDQERLLSSTAFLTPDIARTLLARRKKHLKEERLRSTPAQTTPPRSTAAEAQPIRKQYPTAARTEPLKSQALGRWLDEHLDMFDASDDGSPESARSLIGRYPCILHAKSTQGKNSRTRAVQGLLDVNVAPDASSDWTFVFSPDTDQAVSRAVSFPKLTAPHHQENQKLYTRLAPTKGNESRVLELDISALLATTPSSKTVSENGMLEEEAEQDE